MPKRVEPLSPSAVLNAKPKPAAYVLRDGRGLLLVIDPSGSKLWRLDYRRPDTGKRNTLSLGVFPDVSLKRAREKRDEARSLLADGIDPGVKRQNDKAGIATAAANSFGAIAAEWLAKQHMAPATLEKARWTFDDLVNPYVGNRPIADISAPELLDVFQRIEARGARETAHRTRQRCAQIFRYAIATGRASRDPCADLRGALAPAKVTHRAAITDPNKIADLLRAIAGYTGGPIVGAALKLSALLFARPGELRKMEWAELDLDAADWRIPAAKMKMREEHIVPLPAQAVTILRELQPLTGRGRYVFPGARDPKVPLSEAAINAALRRMDFDKHTMSGHGFRALASTRLNELGWKADIIERQLAHAERNKVRAAYNRAQYMDERRTMMQAWADYLDVLRTGSNVVPIRKAQ
ncbi:MAG: tyrosine-type recombinase/integrase [Proteobacteria bacterium]|nr:tyrosine-type recombinase/integrase [Pseudomonadota bacterium]